MNFFTASNDLYNKLQAIIGTKLVFVYCKILTVKPQSRLPEPEFYRSIEHLHLISPVDV